MKKLFYLPLVAAAMAAICMACEKEHKPERGKEIDPIIVSDEVADFFDDNLYNIGASLFREEGLPVSDKGVAINDPDDLSDTLYNGKPIDWPEIDFDSQTLLIGQFVAAYGGYKILSKNVSVENGVATVELSVGLRNDGNMYPLVPTAIYFWGLYPKLDADSCKIIVPDRFPKTRASRDDEEVFYYFGVEDKKIHVNEVPDKMFVEYTTNIPERGSSQIVSVADLARLKASAEVVSVTPMFEYNGSPFAISDEFIVKLKTTSSLSELQKLAEENGCVLGKENEFVKDKFKLSVPKTSGLNSMQMANMFYETGLFEFSEPEFIYFNAFISSDPLYSSQWGLNNTGQNSGSIFGIDINVEQAWTITKGSSAIKVAVPDTGVDLQHPDLQSNLLPGYDATGLGTNGGPYYSDDNHGTAVAGIVAASQNNIGISGVAPNCKIIPVKGGRDGNGLVGGLNTGDLSNGIYWAVRHGADVINCSWGGYGHPPAAVIHTTINDLLSNGRGGKGCVFVAGTGNDGWGNYVYCPADMPGVIAVGAVSHVGQRAIPMAFGNGSWGSNYGPELDVMAPGVSIITTDRVGSAGYSYDNYAYFWGTSAAAPHVSGVAALMLSANPNLTAKQVSDIIEGTAQKVGGYNYATTSGRPNGTWHEEMGYGLVDAYVAVNTAITPTPPAPSLVSSGSLLSATEASWAGFYAGEPVYWITPTATSATVTVDSGANFDSSATYEWRFDPRLSVRYSMPYYIGFYIPALGSGAYPRRASYRVECRASKNGQYSAWSSLGLFVSDAKPTGPYRAPINVDSLKTTPPPVDVRR